MKPFAALLALAWAAAAQPDPINVQEIIARSSAAMGKNWLAAPGFTYLERDVETKHGGAKTIKSYRVLMLDGSQYNRLIAVNDQPLNEQADAAEERKLRAEIAQRQKQTPAERAKRVAKYRRERSEDNTMMKEMVNAFNFALAGEEKLDGHDVWVFDATPKPDYQPINHEAKVLTAMKGRLWIDKREYQWVKVSAEVTRPVSMYLVAKVSPGTRFELEQEPVADGLWLPKRFSEKVNASALGFLNENSTDDETYHDYRPMPTAAQLMANGGSLRTGDAVR